MIWTVEKCMEHKSGAEKYVLGEKLRIKAFYGFFFNFSKRHHHGALTNYLLSIWNMV
jgi:hypothetical protein